MKHYFILLLSVFTLISCSVTNNYTQMAPIPEKGWDVKYSPASLSEDDSVEWKSDNNFLSQASYQCEDYKVFINSIPVSDYSLYAFIIPTHYSHNDIMSMYLKPNTGGENFVKTTSDCPDVYSNKPTKKILEKQNGENNLCHYKTGALLKDYNEFKLTITDKKNNCKISDLQFVKKSSRIICLFCSIVASPHRTHAYIDKSKSGMILKSTKEAVEHEQQRSGKFTRTIATYVGIVAGMYVGYGVADLLHVSFRNTKASFKKDTGHYLGMYFGAQVGAYTALKIVGGEKTQMINIEYQF